MKRALEVATAEVVFAFGSGAFSIKESTNDFCSSFPILDGDAETEIAGVINRAIGLSANDREALAIGAFKGFESVATPQICQVPEQVFDRVML